jgi:hypothetical protein
MSSSLIEKAWWPASFCLAAAGRDVARGIMILGRGAIGLTGILTLASVLTLLGSEQVRDRVVTAALSAASFAPVDVSSGVDEPRPEAVAREGRWSDWLSARPAGAAEPAQEHVTSYLSRRYRVAENAVRQIVGEAFSTGRLIGIDPMLILAVTAIESSLNPFAQSPVGAQGLMQIMTRVHSDKFASHGGDHAALDPIANLKVGSEILKDMIRRGGSVERGLQLYVGAGNQIDDGGYAARVLGEMARSKLAAGGDVREALASGLGAEIRAGSRPAAELVSVTRGNREVDAVSSGSRAI